MQIIEMQREQYAGHELTFEYDTAAYYDVQSKETPTGFLFIFERRDMARTHKQFVDKLFAPHWDDPHAYALIDHEGKLCAVLEVTKENWNGRLRVTNLLVFDGYRRRGYGSLLMSKAKTLARSMGCRALILETQSCNVGAIRFYLSQGLTLMGFNLCEYSNEDVEKHEMRFEMGLLIGKTAAAE